MARTRLHLTLPHQLADEPVIYNLGQRFDVVTNIRRAAVEERLAWVILEIEGTEDTIASSVAWLEDQGVEVERIDAE